MDDMHWAVATNQAGETIWINLSHVRAMVREDGETRIHFADGVHFLIRENPNAILRSEYLRHMPSTSGTVNYNS